MPFVRPARFYRFNQVQSAPPPPPPPPPGTNESLLTVLAVSENRTGPDKASEIIEFGVPLAADWVTSGQVVTVFDDDGAGGKGSRLANFQWDNEARDATSAKRFGLITGILPALASGATRKLQIWSEVTSQPTGQTISLSDVAALGAFSGGLFKASFDIDGSIHSISVADLITSGSATFNKNSKYLSSDTWRSGPTCTEWVMRAAPMSGAAHHASGNGIHAEFHLAAYKAGVSNVSAGNPIAALRCDFTVKNSDVLRSGTDVTARYYGLKFEYASSLSDPTLVTADQTDPLLGIQRFKYDNQSLAATITFNSTAVGTGKIIARSTGSWDADIIGAHIVSTTGSGKAVITSRQSNASATAYIYENFESGTYTTGQLRQYGIGHAYNTLYRRRAWIGNKPSNIALWGDHNDAVNPTTGSAMAFLASAGWAWDFLDTFASASAGLSNLNLMRSSDGSRRPLTFMGANGSLMGDLGTRIGNAGAQDYIGPWPKYYVHGMIRPDAGGRRMLFENMEYWTTWSYVEPDRLAGTPTTGALPAPPRADNDVMYRWNPAFGLTTVSAHAATFWPWDNDAAHQMCPVVPGYLWTGDLFWLQALQRQDGFTNFMNLSAFYGSNSAATVFGSYAAPSLGGDAQTRQRGWTMRDTLYAAAATPNTARDSLFQSKSYYLDRVSANWQAAKLFIGDERYSAAGSPVWSQNAQFQTGVSNTPMLLEGSWQINFINSTMGLAGILGYTDANWQSAATWFGRYLTDMPTLQSAERDFLSNAFYYMPSTESYSAYSSSWSAAYQRTCLLSPVANGGYGRTRTIGGVMTITSNTSGAGRTVEFNSSAFSQGGTGSAAWYVSGYIAENSGNATDRGYAQITRVISPSAVEVYLHRPFNNGASFSASSVFIPGPHPQDYTGDAESLLNTGNDYAETFVLACRALHRAGIDTSAAEAYMRGRTSFSYTNPPQYRIR